MDILDSIIESAIERLNSLLQDRIVGVTLVGSHAIDVTSLRRPDIDVIIFLKNWATGDDYWKLGQIWNTLCEQYSTEVNICLEFRPFRFVYPRIYDETRPDVFLNPIYANMAEKDMPRPFGVSKYVLSGFQHMRKVIQGEDILGKMDLQFSIEEMKNDMLTELFIFFLQVSRAPAQYDLAKEYRFLFNEAFSLAKFCVYCGIELAMNEQEIRERKYLSLLEKKEEIPRFYAEHYSTGIADMVNYVHLAWDNFLEWQRDKVKVHQLYNIALALFRVMSEKCL